jgi:hypothetical protein
VNSPPCPRPAEFDLPGAERPLGDPPLKTVSALQLYLNLKQLHGRGEEAAQAVYDAEIAATFAATPHLPK